jgi:hypothetical protein
MKKSITRISQIDDWVFEVKMVKSIKSEKYGEPYSAVAHMTVNGDHMYIDSQLSADNVELNKGDFKAIYEFCQSLGMKNIGYDRIKNGHKSSKHIEILPDPSSRTNIRLVK